jgi:hypothetical protein
LLYLSDRTTCHGNDGPLQISHMKKLKVLSVLALMISTLYAFGPADKEIPFPGGTANGPMSKPR